MLQSMKTLRLYKKPPSTSSNIATHHDSLNLDKDIPDDIIMLIVEYLPMKEVLHLGLVVSEQLPQPESVRFLRIHQSLSACTAFCFRHFMVRLS
jgi:hypothetical protein